MGPEVKSTASWPIQVLSAKHETQPPPDFFDKLVAICYAENMTGPIRQLEIAGQELAPFLSASREVTPLDSRGKWVVYLIRRAESDEAMEIIRQAIRQAPNASQIPVKMNFCMEIGEVEIDDSNREVYVVHYEDKGEGW